jgi:hypothetical protein
VVSFVTPAPELVFVPPFMASFQLRSVISFRVNEIRLLLPVTTVRIGYSDSATLMSAVSADSV